MTAMNPSWLIAPAAIVLCTVMAWAFRTLPREEWQFIASVPRKKEASGSWTALNLTFYGFFTASAYLLAAVVFLLLAGSVGSSVIQAISLLTLVFALCVPASRLIALHVDKTKSGFTVAGATFVGLLTLPVAIYLMNAVWQRAGADPIPYSAVLAAAAIAYCFGEGVGRFACISFGCCYGKPLTEAGPVGARIFRNLNFVFHGGNKKITYASGLEGVKVIPIQALTAIVYSLTGMVGVALFLDAHYAVAFVFVIALSQCWRAYSETLRADYRGEGKITAYQAMALMAVPIAGCIAWWMPAEDLAPPKIEGALAMFENPFVVLFLQATWIALFLFTGVSDTTRSVVSFHVAPGFQGRHKTEAPLTDRKL